MLNTHGIQHSNPHGKYFQLLTFYIKQLDDNGGI